ncbi:methyltransferase, putative [Toxoplasma gondii ME49]|uniref:Methyltransferase-like protein1 n=14 Tax=Toxoplasma gondii TaxID=5811 RepID=B9PJM6_TOXGV|nr:methyltransferase, putative [Toxoplasma gondii ME49]EPR60872.1 putative methyltransferase [Toxoplasma gondii GT1]ESS34834.1 putative methyltransferase [Toxoplasma gondii VEG]KAF4639186.1 putative methyltransferase [Toxoplasma gondii]KFG40773.1 putative methyltransferase [Toxoplasma gondii p89]KFG44610.1 putative methyltransferase [Toxoplasma gondii GAB2-2007-GAL-DOM2]KFG55767.1 putative methyltransferase [Toxoplasma gondii FOU]KFG65753.1 putative methyltransferase [Toxoplasma gondii RUB]|eukprot:XP_002364253.1 methyltransferase, putative [Toxoplasma gondii ME49]
MTAYGKVDYWDERYKRDVEPFDWFQRYAGLKPILLEAGLQASSRILVLGCGTSRVSEEMYADGYRKIVNVDYSNVCISHMQRRCADKEEMTFLHMNALDMKQLDDGDFDLVFDKGTMDCVLCGDNSFDNVQKMLREVSRILAPGGVYIVVSYGQPNFRLSHLQREEYGWSVTMKTIQKPSINVQAPIDEKDNVHYVYICKKAASEAAQAPAQVSSDAAKGAPTN